MTFGNIPIKTEATCPYILEKGWIYRFIKCLNDGYFLNLLKANLPSKLGDGDFLAIQNFVSGASATNVFLFFSNSLGFVALLFISFYYLSKLAWKQKQNWT